MRVLVIGGGGREHALCWSLRQSPRVTHLMCAPGNAGIAAVAECLPVDQGSAESIRQLARETAADLVVIGPEIPLAAGAVDALQADGVRVFGPTRAAAQLESSKSFAKAFMQRHSIPTARYVVATQPDDVTAGLAGFSAPVVVKADGLAAGKGVVIAATLQEAESAARGMLADGSAAVVLEEFLAGEELSFFALCDGTTAVPIAAAQDHKRLLDGDKGPNTGGMGAYSIDSLMTVELRDWLTANVAQRTVDGMRAEGVPFRGILFCGMMLTPDDGPKVLEFNTRWGDPETQAILLRMGSDVLALVEASIDGQAHALTVKLKPGASVCVIAASEGYPAAPKTGRVIAGLQEPLPEGVEIFHSGTVLREGEVITAGGRVLGVTAFAEDLQSAIAEAYTAISRIHFDGMQVRRDIGHRALQR